MRVLVTGGAGFIGSHVVDGLLAAGHEVLVVDDLSTGSRELVNDGARLVEMDIANPELSGVVEEFAPNAVSHLAAQASVAASMSDPVADARVNIVGGLNVFDAAVSSGATQFIYVTTGGALYGEPDYLPFDEDHPIRPASAYGLSKWTLERYLAMLAPGKVAIKVLRVANAYGPRQDPHGEAGVVSIFGLSMLGDHTVTVFGDGEQTRDFVYVRDLVSAHELALNAASSTTVNLSSGVELSINELFDKLVAETGFKGAPVFAPERPGDMRRSVLANRRATEVLGWSPQVSIDQGLRETVEWLRRRP